MNEEETLKEIERIIFFTTNGMLCCEKEEGQAIQGLLDLYQKEKEKNKLVETYKSYMLPENVEFVIIQKKELEELKDIEADYIRRMESSNNVLLEQGYLSKDELRKIMASNTELSAYHKIKELLEEK